MLAPLQHSIAIDGIDADPFEEDAGAHSHAHTAEHDEKQVVYLFVNTRIRLSTAAVAAPERSAYGAGRS